MVRTLLAVVLLVLVSACAAPRAARVVARPAAGPVATATSTSAASATAAAPGVANPPASRLRARELAAHVKRLVGVKSLRRISRRVPDDCSGLIRWAYLQEDVDLARHADWRGGNAVATFFQLAEDAGALHTKAPQPGDLVFFRETYDRNRDGKRNDGLTHLGVVDAVNADGSVTFVHRANSGVKRSVMTLARAGEHRDEQGRVLNDFVRAAGRGYTGKLTGELFVAFASSERMLAHVEPQERGLAVAKAGRPAASGSGAKTKRSGASASAASKATADAQPPVKATSKKLAASKKPVSAKPTARASTKPGQGKRARPSSPARIAATPEPCTPAVARDPKADAPCATAEKTSPPPATSPGVEARDDSEASAPPATSPAAEARDDSEAPAPAGAAHAETAREIADGTVEDSAEAGDADAGVSSELRDAFRRAEQSASGAE